MSLKQMVQSWSDKYASALNSPAAKGAGSFFASDADLLPPGPDNLKGPDAIQAFWAAVAEHYHNARLVTVDAAQMGTDYIREIGTYYAEPKNASGPNLSGKYVFIWRKIGDDWKIWTDVWTSHSGQT
jgi:ketosteroid isomerase-like protein